MIQNDRVYGLILVLAAALTAGCNQEPTTAQRIENVKEETKDVAKEISDYSFAQKAQFAERMKTQLAQIDKDLDELDAKIARSSDAVKAEAKPRVQALREKAADLGKQVKEVENATESTWDSVKAGTKKAYEGLKEGFQQSRQWVSDKIAP